MSNHKKVEMPSSAAELEAFWKLCDYMDSLETDYERLELLKTMVKKWYPKCRKKRALLKSLKNRMGI